MQSFVALLRGSGGAGPPLADLGALAGGLCPDLEDDPARAQPLVAAQLCPPLLADADAALACARALAQREQHQAACRLLEGCQVPGGSQELVQLWNDIHYQLAARRLGTASLTPVQRFRCRKRHPPPPALCPEGLKSRTFAPEVRRRLQDFAAAVGTNPGKAERERLAQETGLSPEQVYNWFANFRRRQRALGLGTAPLQSAPHPGRAARPAAGPEEPGLSGAPAEGPGSREPPCAAPGFPGDRSPSEPLAGSLPGAELCPEEPGPVSAVLAPPCLRPGLCAPGPCNLLALPEPWLLSLALRPEAAAPPGPSPAPRPAAPAAAEPIAATGRQGPAWGGGPGAQTGGFVLAQLPLAAAGLDLGLSAPELAPECEAGPRPPSQAQRPDGQAPGDAFWGASVLLELSGGRLG